tara:strand:+ start:245 stop:898 length:654 start_codon:yes stop_codon:yes gene_type:complete
MLKAKQIDKIFALFQKQEPNPKIELDYYNDFTLLVAVVLSAQATDNRVNKITPQIFAVADSPYKMTLLGSEALKEMIKSIGLYNNKANNLLAAAKKMYEQHNNKVPETFAKLCSLPGVGPKSANVLLNSLFHHESIAVDRHVFRVSNRIGLCKTKTVKATERDLMKKVGKPWRRNAHHWLVLHGRYVCKARNPKCVECIIKDLCQFKDKISSDKIKN